MNCSPRNNGFVLIMPLVCMAIVALSGAYILIYKIDNLAHGTMRHERHIKETYEKVSCEELFELYVTLDPDYSIGC